MKSRFFFSTYTAANLSLIAYGIMALIQPGVLLQPFSENVYQFPVEAANAITYLSGLYRLIGYFNILPGLLGLIILYRYWVTRGGWYLQLVIGTTCLAYLGPVVFDNTVGTIGFFEILEHVVFGMVLISGLIMIIGGRQNTINGLPANSREARLKQASRFEANLKP
ncbi:MAG: hypothetical protein ACWGN2_06100 [Anaerolineales bacterium]